MECPGLSTLWASGPAGMYLRSRGEKEVEVLCRLLAARSGVAAGITPGVRNSLEFPRFLSEAGRPGCPTPAKNADRRSGSARSGLR